MSIVHELPLTYFQCTIKGPKEALAWFKDDQGNFTLDKLIPAPEGLSEALLDVTKEELRIVNAYEGALRRYGSDTPILALNYKWAVPEHHRPLVEWARAQRVLDTFIETGYVNITNFKMYARGLMYVNKIVMEPGELVVSFYGTGTRQISQAVKSKGIQGLEIACVKLGDW